MDDQSKQILRNCLLKMFIIDVLLYLFDFAVLIQKQQVMLLIQTSNNRYISELEEQYQRSNGYFVVPHTKNQLLLRIMKQIHYQIFSSSQNNIIIQFKDLIAQIINHRVSLDWLHKIYTQINHQETLINTYKQYMQSIANIILQQPQNDSYMQQSSLASDNSDLSRKIVNENEQLNFCRQVLNKESHKLSQDFKFGEGSFNFYQPILIDEEGPTQQSQFIDKNDKNTYNNSLNTQTSYKISPEAACIQSKAIGRNLSNLSLFKSIEVSYYMPIEKINKSQCTKAKNTNESVQFIDIDKVVRPSILTKDDDSSIKKLIDLQNQQDLERAKRTELKNIAYITKIQKRLKNMKLEYKLKTDRKR